MKKLLLFSWVFMQIASVFSYDFSAQVGSDTLYFTITNANSKTVKVVCPDISNWNCYTQPTGNLVIPSTVSNGGVTYSVTAIGENAFIGCESLTSVTIPNSVTTIGNNAFAGSRFITSVTIPNSVTTIGNGAFSGCWGLTSVTIPNSVTSIGKFAFNGCSNLTSVTIPNSVTSIEYCTFATCIRLTSVTIPNSVTSIGDMAFCYCSSLTSITIPNSVTYIGDMAFNDCEDLTTVYWNADSAYIFQDYSTLFGYCYKLTNFIFGNNVRIIPNHVCNYLYSLTSVTIPNSVTHIGDSAFYYCDGLSTVTFEGTTPPSIGNNAFAHIYSNAVVYIPCGSLSYFVERMPNIRANNFIDSQISFSAVSEDNNKGTVKILNEPTCVNPSVVINAIAADNYRFDHWSDGNTDNPRLFYVTGDTTLVAYFTPKTSISDLDDSKVKVYAAGNSIVIELAHAQEYENEPVTVYDVLGREIAKGRLEGNSLRLPVQPSGIYIVQINGLMPYKVVVQ
ncbi:MAG: leucine-rich repeat domain-containing protein [Bacteroidales bacterium]|nr:leucine-rich repeat domain-containing protein [Bacteroidales bacterium]